MQKPKSLEVNGLEFRTIISYMVYIWKRDSECLFIGSSEKGMGRFNTSGLITEREVLDNDRVEFIWCDTEREMGDLVKKLTLELKPKYPNKGNYNLRPERITTNMIGIVIPDFSKK